MYFDKLRKNRRSPHNTKTEVEDLCFLLLAESGDPMTYDINEHKHRFAAWAASRAASTKTCRFNVLQGKSIIESIKLHDLISDPNNLPSPENIDTAHRQWRDLAILAAKARDLLEFSHGIAAKLINVYLKSAVICAGHETHANVTCLHPPIDSLLLESLCEINTPQISVFKNAKKQKWSKFSSDEYQSVINAIKVISQDSPLWAIEKHWRGYQ